MSRTGRLQRRFQKILGRATEDRNLPQLDHGSASMVPAALKSFEVKAEDPTTTTKPRRMASSVGLAGVPDVPASSTLQKCKETGSVAHKAATEHTDLNEPLLMHLVDLIRCAGSTSWSLPLLPVGRHALPTPYFLLFSNCGSAAAAPAVERTEVGGRKDGAGLAACGLPPGGRR